MGMHDKRVIVTGASGFVGTNLCRWIKKNRSNWHATCLDVEKPQETISSFLYLDWDLTAQNFDFAGVEYIFHLATLNSRFSNDKPRITIEDMTKMNANFLRCLSCNDRLPLFVNMSSSSVYGLLHSIHYQGFNEHDSLEPMNAYGIGKANQEIILKGYTNMFYDKDFNVLNLRPCNIYGPYSHCDLSNREDRVEVIPKTIIHALQGISPTLYCGPYEQDMTRDFIYVEDVCRYAVLLAEKFEARSQRFATFNLGVSNQITIKKTMELICEMIDRTIKVTYSPQSRKNEINKRWLNNGKLKEALTDEEYKPIDFNIGLKKTIEYIRGKIT